MKEASNTKGTKRWFWLGLLASWLGILFFLFILPGFLIWGGALAVLIHRKSNLKWNLLAFSSWVMIPLLCFSFATRDYFMGTAKLKYSGLPNEEFYNLDPEFRSWKQSSGCMIIGPEIFTHPVNNTAVKFWTRLLGFQKNAYAGIYPDKKTANDWLDESGSSIRMSKSENELTFEIHGRSFGTERAWYGMWLEEFDETEARYTLINGELLIIQPLSERHIETTFLFDYHSGENFATYFDNTSKTLEKFH